MTLLDAMALFVCFGWCWVTGTISSLVFDDHVARLDKFTLVVLWGGLSAWVVASAFFQPIHIGGL